MLKSSAKKIVAMASAIAMVLQFTIIAPINAAKINPAVMLGGKTFAAASTIDSADGDPDGTFTIKAADGSLETTTPAENNWEVGKYLTFELSIGSATADSPSGKGDFTGLSLKFNPTDSRKTGPALTVSSYNTANKTFGFYWKGTGAVSSVSEISGFTAKIGEKYRFIFYYKASNKVTAYMYASDGTLVATADDLPTRTASEVGDTLAGVTVRGDVRPSALKSAFTLSDIIVYDSFGPDEIEVTANAVKTAEDSEETTDIVLKQDNNDSIYIGSKGGEIKLSDVVKKNGEVVSGYSTVYTVANSKGISVTGDTIKIPATVSKGETTFDLVAYLTDGVNTYESSTAVMKIKINKADATPEEYVESVTNSLPLYQYGYAGNVKYEIKPNSSNVYVATEGLGLYAGDGVANITWQAYIKNAKDEWVKSEIINKTTGEYTPVAGYCTDDSYIKMVATVEHAVDATVIPQTKEFICNVRDYEKEIAFDVEKLEIDINEKGQTTDIDLPTVGEYGSVITWTSSNNSVITRFGEVKRPSYNDGDAKVTLTASIENGNKAETKDFLVTVTKKAKTNSGSSGSGSNSGFYQPVTIPTPTPTTAPVEVTVSFNDLDSVEWAKESINALAKKGVISGRDDKTFAPNDEITRAEFAKVLVNAFGLINPNVNVSILTDVSSSDWYYTSVASAYEKGIITGYGDGTFGVNDKVTRQDMSVMIYRAAKAANVTINTTAAAIDFADASEIASYANEAVVALQRAGVVSGVSDTEFAPTATATRAQAAKMIYALTK